LSGYFFLRSLLHYSNIVGAMLQGGRASFETRPAVAPQDEEEMLMASIIYLK
jgi:hypothetical protein